MISHVQPWQQIWVFYFTSYNQPTSQQEAISYTILWSQPLLLSTGAATTYMGSIYSATLGFTCRDGHCNDTFAGGHPL